MWPNPQETADLVTFTEEILNGKFSFGWAISLQITRLMLQLLNFSQNSQFCMKVYRTTSEIRSIRIKTKPIMNY